MNQKIPCSQRILAFFLAIFMLCSLSLPVLAEAAPSETPPLPAETSATSETATPTEDSTDSTTAENNDTTTLSDAAQAFVDAVAALDRDAIVSASNAWGLASKAWQADQSNTELESTLIKTIYTITLSSTLILFTTIRNCAPSPTKQLVKSVELVTAFAPKRNCQLSKNPKILASAIPLISESTKPSPCGHRCADG